MIGSSAITIRTIVSPVIYAEPYHKSQRNDQYSLFPHFLTIPHPFFISYSQVMTKLASFLILTRISRHVKENATVKQSVMFFHNSNLIIFVRVTS